METHPALKVRVTWQDRYGRDQFMYFPEMTLQEAEGSACNLHAWESRTGSLNDFIANRIEPRPATLEYAPTRSEGRL